MVRFPGNSPIKACQVSQFLGKCRHRDSGPRGVSSRASPGQGAERNTPTISTAAKRGVTIGRRRGTRWTPLVSGALKGLFCTSIEKFSMCATSHDVSCSNLHLEGKIGRLDSNKCGPPGAEGRHGEWASHTRGTLMGLLLDVKPQASRVARLCSATGRVKTSLREPWQGGAKAGNPRRCGDLREVGMRHGTALLGTDYPEARREPERHGEPRQRSRNGNAGSRGIPARPFAALEWTPRAAGGLRRKRWMSPVNSGC